MKYRTVQGPLRTTRCALPMAATRVSDTRCTSDRIKYKYIKSDRIPRASGLRGLRFSYHEKIVTRGPNYILHDQNLLQGARSVFCRCKIGEIFSTDWADVRLAERCGTPCGSVYKIRWLYNVYTCLYILEESSADVVQTPQLASASTRSTTKSRARILGDDHWRAATRSAADRLELRDDASRCSTPPTQPDCHGRHD
eukprot:1188307-Prorocentrum_minimum.AAC.1